MKQNEPLNANHVFSISAGRAAFIMDDSSSSLSLSLSVATKVLIAPVVILLVVVLGALTLVIGNIITHMNTHAH